MKYNKKIFLALLFVVILGAKSVYAEDVASIGSNKYSSLNDAISAATDNSEIKLLTDITRIEVPAGKKISIDLNGNTVNPEAALATSLLPETIAVKNYGTLTLKGSGKIKCYQYVDCIVNYENSTLNVKDLEMEDANATEVIVNSGNISLTNVKITNDGYAKLFVNSEKGTFTVNSGTYSSKGLLENRGTMNLKGGTFNIHDTSLSSGYNYGTLNISGGTYSLSAYINNVNILNISGGTFNGNRVAENYNPSGTYGTTNPIITINNSNINTTNTPFSNASVTDNSKIVINGGTISCSSDDYILSDYGNNTEIVLNGGTLQGTNSKGIFISSKTKFTIGTNDEEVSETSPVINMPKGNLVGSLSQTSLYFYDGYINLDEQIDNSIDVITPTDYYVAYDKNSDNSYKAYLKKSGNTDTINPKTSTTPSSSTTIKVPDTFKENKNIFKVIGLITMILGTAVILNSMKSKKSR